MPIAKITGPGLAGIAISVALLWGCFVGERRMAERASSERARVMRDVERMRRQRSEPVSAPSIPSLRHVQVTAG